MKIFVDALVLSVTLVFLKIKINNASKEALIRKTFLQSQPELKILFRSFRKLSFRRLDYILRKFPTKAYEYTRIQKNAFLRHMENLLFILTLYDKIYHLDDDDKVAGRIFKVLVHFPRLHLELLDIKLHISEEKAKNQATIDLAAIVDAIDNNVIYEIKNFVEVTIDKLPSDNPIQTHFRHCYYVFDLYKTVQECDGNLDEYDINELVADFEKATEILLNDGLAAQSLVVQLLVEELQRTTEKNEKRSKKNEKTNMKNEMKPENPKLNTLYNAFEAIPKDTLEAIGNFIDNILPRLPEKNALYFHLNNSNFLINVYKFTRLMPGTTKTSMGRKICGMKKKVSEGFSRFLSKVRGRKPKTKFRFGEDSENSPPESSTSHPSSASTPLPPPSPI